MKNTQKEIFESYEPKMFNRWMVEFPENFNIKSYVVNYISSLEYDVNNNKWENLRIDLYDPVVPSTSTILTDLINNSRGRLTSFNFKIMLLGPVGDNVAEIYFERACIENIDLGDFDYEKSTPRIITLNVSFPKCVIS